MHRMIVGLITCWALIGGFGPTPARAEKADTVARFVVEHFMNAVKAKDLEEIMKTVDVPWVSKEGVIRERQELRKHFQQRFAARDYSQMNYEVKELVSFARFSELYGKEMKKRDSKLWAEVEKIATEHDRVLRLKVEKGGGDEFIALVRSHGGERKILGLLD